MADLTIALAAAPTADVAALIGELNDELGALYTPEQRHGLALDAIFQPHIRFFLAWRDGRAVGCGGVAFLDGFAELKRMYVRPEMRGQASPTPSLPGWRPKLLPRDATCSGWRPALIPWPPSVSIAGWAFAIAMLSLPMPPCRRPPPSPAFSWKSGFYRPGRSRPSNPPKPLL